jgi:oxidase EvaA
MGRVTVFADTDEFHDWFAYREQANDYEVSRIPLDEMEGWHTEPDTGDIAHSSGKFFAIRGLEVEIDHHAVTSWSQPIIVQPEIGILGILVKVVDGEVFCLMQAKMEPGNVNLLQLSPTVQATRSNYTRVHKGNPVPYLEHFLRPRSGRTAFDALQSEQGSWFLGKRNRNMIVEITEEVPVGEDFCWLSLAQLATLLKEPNLVNMDSRTVLSGVPFLFPGQAIGRAGALPVRTKSRPRPLHSTGELLSWFTEAKSRYRLGRRLVPLSGLPRWERATGELVHEDKKYFSVTGVHVRATSREVKEWSQPMVEPVGRGVIAFLGRQVNGRFHLLVHARTEAGTQDIVEMSPTVKCIPENYADQPREAWPPYLDVVERAPAERILLDLVHSEEGGRFFHAESRYLLVDVGEEFDLEVPDDFCWMTVEQLTGFVCYGNHVNVEARCLLSCLTGAAASPRRRPSVIG